MPAAKPFSLVFQPRLDGRSGHKELRDGLSAVLRVGPTLWLANDESASLERLRIADGKATGHEQFALGDYLDLPAGHDEEVDVEGLAAADGYLWVVGSHSRKRCRPDPEADPRKIQKQLGRVQSEANRFLLARIPLVERDGLPALAKKDGKRRAQQVPGTPAGNALTTLLKRDRHLGPFVGLPGKENGFDIEGLAVAGERLFLGLRGPVLRGWAMILELRLEGDGKHLLLAPVDGKKQLRKHFLHLGGLGIRDLCLQGDDLLVLAGPTMSLDGPVRVLRWPLATHCEGSCLVQEEELETVLEVPFGAGCDHAEGIALFGDGQLLVVRDQPADKRQVGESTLVADVFAL